MAALAGARHAPLPHRLSTILKGESLLNDAATLLLYRLAVSAAMAESFELQQVAPGFVLGVAASVVVGPVLGLAFLEVRRRVSDAPTAIVLQFVAAFGLWLGAERLHLSGVLVVVTFAMTVARKAPGVTPPPRPGSSPMPSGTRRCSSSTFWPSCSSASRSIRSWNA